MKNIVILYACLMSLATVAPREESQPCSKATGTDKEALITELICVENRNKSLVLDRNDYRGLIYTIEGRDGSHCLAIRCINRGELSIALDASRDGANFTVEFGDGERHLVTSKVSDEGSIAVPLDNFWGIIGPTLSDGTASTCQNNSMSYIKVTYKDTSAPSITLKGIRLEVKFTDDSTKVFFEDNEVNATLQTDKSFTVSRKQLLDNQEFIKAKAGSCSDN